MSSQPPPTTTTDAHSPLLHQLLQRIDSQQTKQHVVVGASHPSSASSSDFSDSERQQIREWAASSSPHLHSLLHSSLSVTELIDKLRALLRSNHIAGDASSSADTTSSAGAATTGDHSAGSSSSASASPSSTSISTNAPSSSSASAASLTSTSTTSAAMEVDHSAATTAHAAPAAPAASSANGAAAAAAAPAASAMDVDAQSGSAFVRTQLKAIDADQKKGAEACVRHLAKMLAALKKSPNLLATRKLRADNIAVKKFVADVPGALAILKFVGYAQVELTDKKVPYLIIDEATAATADAKAKLDEAIDAVAAAVAVYDSPPAASAAPVDTVRKMCEGKCGFFGSPETEGFCSQCFKKKFLAGGAMSPAKSGSAPAHNNPFVTPPKGSAASAAAAPAAAAAAAGLSLNSVPNSGDVKCLKHCGRLGSPAFNGFCQVCYDRITAQGQKPLPKRWKCLFDGAMVKLRAVHRFNLGKKPVQEHKNRCWTCSKKIGITGFECRCRYTFCAAHRYMEQHDCSYDIKSLHRKKLKKDLEEIRASKVIKL